MWILLMVVLLGDVHVNSTHTFFETERGCKAAAREFESHTSTGVKFKSFCMKGD